MNLSVLLAPHLVLTRWVNSQTRLLSVGVKVLFTTVCTIADWSTVKHSLSYRSFNTVFTIAG